MSETSQRVRGSMQEPDMARATAPAIQHAWPAAKPRLDSVRASEKLNAEIAGFFARARAWKEGGKVGAAPVLAVRGSAGLGKTTAVLDAVSAPEWRTKRVLYLVPSLELADQLREKAIEDYGIDARVIRGRSQPMPGQDKDGFRMCIKHELAAGLSALSINVTSTLCRSVPQTKGGKEEVCEFAAECPYLAQLANKKPGLLIAAHQYLALTMEGFKTENVDMVVVDETFWQSLVRRGHVDLARFQLTRPPGQGRPRKGERKEAATDRVGDERADFDFALEKVRRVLASPLPLTLDRFRAEGLTPDECKRSATTEYSRLGDPGIRAGMAHDAQRAAMAKAKVDEAFGFARIWKILGAELALPPAEGTALPRSQLVGIVRDDNWWNPKAEAEQCVLHTFHTAEPKLQATSLVILDADLDAEIAARFYPAVSDVVEVDADWSGCHVTQILDRTVSRSMLAGTSHEAAEQTRIDNRREDLRAIMADMAARHGHPMRFDEDAREEDRARRPLLVSYKAVEDRWNDDGHLDDRPALPYAVAHLNGIRGKDTWKHATGIVVAGRLEPGVEAVEELARAVFYADPRPLAFVGADGEGRKSYPKVARPVRFRDGRVQAVDVPAHPDARCDAILRQIRDAELMQALARIRPIHRTSANRCEVILATNVPLDGLVIDRAATWRDLVPDEDRRMLVQGVLPDTAADCVAAYPGWFASVEAVQKARQRDRLKVDISLLSTSVQGNVHAKDLRISDIECVRVTYAFIPKEAGGVGRRRFRTAQVRLAAGESAAVAACRLAAVLPEAVDIEVAQNAPRAPVALTPELAPALPRVRAPAIRSMYAYLQHLRRPARSMEAVEDGSPGGLDVAHFVARGAARQAVGAVFHHP